MTRRLQVLLDDDELDDIRAAARAQKLTVAEWVRGALRGARREPTATAERKLAALRQGTRYEFPTGDIEAMLGEIEQGYAPPQPAGGRRTGRPATRR
ncbi:MAG: antitoxin [Chloroflexi bacterium]|nr:antitoxin [Chloroflexota bacterium]